MCGIWTRAGLNRSLSESELLFPVRMLAHRGPDSYGWYSDSRVGMVHTRLSIIDLSSGGQPLQSFDKKWIGIVNGELYDYQILRERLVAKGVQFKTKSDSEVLLNLFAKEGVAGLKNISGEWAFIFYNAQEQKLFFARDIHGVKPLFYKKTSSSFTLASETKALGEESPVLSENYVKTFFSRTMLPPFTALEDCYHVLPGRLYCFDIQSQKISWEPLQQLPLGVDARSIKGAEAIDAVEEALRASVKRRLVADVEVGCYLSGGIDSALTTALAVQLGAKPKAFTVGFADKDFDERHIAGEIAAHLGIDHHVCMMTSKNFLPSLIKSIVAFENPITNPHGAAKNLLSELASQSVKVVLSGEGADEWFGGYAYLRIRKIQQFAKQHPVLGARLMEAFFKSEMGRSMNHLDGRSTVNQKIFADLFYGHQPAVLGRLSKHRSYNYITGEILEDRLRWMAGNLSGYLREEWQNYSVDSSEWDLNTWCGLRVDLLHYILANVGDRQEMSHSIEGRTPFLDPQVTRLAGQIHPNTLMRGLNEKFVLKKVAARMLPPHLAERKKHPFFAPLKYFYLRENQEPIEAYVQAARAATPWLNWKNVDRLLYHKNRPVTSSLEPLKSSVRTTLFSLGVVAQDLRKEQMIRARGYDLPMEVQHLSSFQVRFDSK